MNEADLLRIIIDEERQEYIVILKEKKGERLLPISIGINEISAIKFSLSGYTSIRPLTHDLIINILDSLEVKIEKIVIDNLIDNTFHAKIYLLKKDGEIKIIDARPSDSIALMVRKKIPLFIAEEVFQKLQS